MKQIEKIVTEMAHLAEALDNCLAELQNAVRRLNRLEIIVEEQTNGLGN